MSNSTSLISFICSSISSLSNVTGSSTSTVILEDKISDLVDILFENLKVFKDSYEKIDFINTIEITTEKESEEKSEENKNILEDVFDYTEDFYDESGDLLPEFIDSSCVGDDCDA
mgnify:CR=1 FL=1